LLSAFLHSRRPNEDPLTFTATMRAMRDLPFGKFIQTEDGKLEARQQLIMLGYDDIHGQPSSDDLTCLERAKTSLSTGRTLFAPCTRAVDFLDAVARLSDIRMAHSARVNSGDYGLQRSDVNEFNESLDQILSANVRERQLYKLVVKTFAALRDDAQHRVTGFKSWQLAAMDARHRLEASVFLLGELGHRARAAMIGPGLRR